jgi:hypothetical protein
VGAGAGAGVGGVFGEDEEAVFGGLGVQCAERLRKVLIDCQRTLLARLVFDRGDDGAGFVDQVDALHAVDWGQLPKVVLEAGTGCDHRWNSCVILHAAYRSRMYRTTKKGASLQRRPFA